MTTKPKTSDVEPGPRNSDEGALYLSGWRARREGRPIPIHVEHEWYKRGWREADEAIRAGRDIGQGGDDGK